MHPNWPLRWPAGWGDPAAVDLQARARDLGVTVCDAGHPPDGVEIAKGEWPGIRITSGAGDAASGPTGAPWIDSNGWLIRLTRAQRTGGTIWVTADPPKSSEIVPLVRHLVALTDAAVHGGCWVLAPDNHLAGDAAGWRTLMRAVAFFQTHTEWAGWRADAVLGVVSGFAGSDEFFSHEVLNLLARTSVSYAIVDKGQMTTGSLRGLRAALYADGQAPSGGTRQILLDFAEQGGLLITTPAFGKLPGSAAPGQTHPRYELRRLGKGRIAVARETPTDPYEVAQDAQILVSHRYDRMRFFNGFLLGGYRTVSPDGKRLLAHVINYGGDAGDDPLSVRLAGRFRSARLWTFEKDAPAPLRLIKQEGSVEVYLPQLSVYGGVELEVEDA